MRKTKAYSISDRDWPWIERLAREAKRQKPRTSESGMLVQVIQEHFRHQREVREVLRPKRIMGFIGEEK